MKRSCRLYGGSTPTGGKGWRGEGCGHTGSSESRYRRDTARNAVPIIDAVWRGALSVAALCAIFYNCGTSSVFFLCCRASLGGVSVDRCCPLAGGVFLCRRYFRRSCLSRRRNLNCLYICIITDQTSGTGSSGTEIAAGLGIGRWQSPKTHPIKTVEQL